MGTVGKEISICSVISGPHALSRLCLKVKPLRLWLFFSLYFIVPTGLLLICKVESSNQLENQHKSNNRMLFEWSYTQALCFLQIVWSLRPTLHDAFSRYEKHLNICCYGDVGRVLLCSYTVSIIPFHAFWVGYPSGYLSISSSGQT